MDGKKYKRKDFVDLIKGEIGEVVGKRIGRRHVLDIIDIITDNINDVIIDGGHVDLYNFGIFHAYEHPEKKLKHPETGEDIVVPASKVIKFKPYGAFKKRVKNDERYYDVIED